MSGRKLGFGGALVAAIVIAFVLVYPAPPPPRPDPDPAPAAAVGPCAFEPIDVDKYGNKPFRNPDEESSRKGRLDTTVTVKYTKRSKVSLAGCPLHLRSYNGGLFGNTLRVKAGDTLNLKLRNRLPKQSPRDIEENFQQEASNAHIVHRPNPYNTTNVHYHGLHVSPRGNSDNVYLAIEPKTTFDYEVELPADHPPGTYWYHAHAHGSTAIQVASGMAGALIVEDDPQEIPAPLRAANRRDKVMLFQSILYDTDGETKEIEAFFPPPNEDGSDPACTEGLPTCTWQASHRRTTINGQIVPEIRMRPGEVQRWRMIDGTYRESLFLELEGHPLHEIALDGNYLGKVDTWEEGQPVHLEPGYRSDVLVKASEEPGTYDLTDAASSAENSLRGVAEDENVVARVVVSGKPIGMDLPSDAQMASLAPFPDRGNIANEATGVETAIFKIGGDPAGSNKTYFTINYKAFALDNVRTVFLDHVDEWRLGTVGSDDGFPDPSPSPSPTVPPQPPPPHVFHIHVNPFLTFREGPDGKQEGVWKDTLLIQGEPVSVYTTYKDFTGKFVIHCHILDHEDLGMMEAVRVVRESSLNPEPVHDH